MLAEGGVPREMWSVSPSMRQFCGGAKDPSQIIREALGTGLPTPQTLVVHGFVKAMFQTDRSLAEHTTLSFAEAPRSCSFSGHLFIFSRSDCAGTWLSLLIRPCIHQRATSKRAPLPSSTRVLADPPREAWGPSRLAPSSPSAGHLHALR